MVQLVGVDHGPDRLHHAVGDVEGEDVDDPAIAVAGDRAGLAVNPGQLDGGAPLRSLAVQPEHEPGDLLRTVDRPGCGPGLASAVANGDHVGREQFEQAVHVAAARRVEEPAGHLFALLA
jgi:hypothetical protein